MKVLVIGGTGKIGSSLVPSLVEAGYQVVSMSRGRTKPHHSHWAWSNVERIEVDRVQADKFGAFSNKLAEVEAEVVIDLLCYDACSAEMLVEALRGRVRHLIVCGTISVYGISREIPTTETMPRKSSSEYGRKKAEMEALLLGEARSRGFPITVLHPGHVVGRGWVPVNPEGNFNPEVFEILAEGGELILPNDGMALLHHVHADDVAQAFVRAIQRWNVAVGESFNVTSPAAVTLRHYAKTVGSWFGQDLRIRFLPWSEWSKTIDEKDVATSRDHTGRSPCFSIEKARRLLGYEPRYTSLEAVRESLAWLISTGRLRAPELK